MKPKICIVSSCGGHLTEVRTLRAAYDDCEHFYVINKRAFVPADMEGKTYFIRHSERDLLFFVNLWEAWIILRKEKPELDGLELRTSNMDEDCRRRAAAIQRDYHLTGLGSSDAHSEAVLGFCYTEFAQPVRDNRELVTAIGSRRATAHDGNPSGR